MADRPGGVQSRCSFSPFHEGEPDRMRVGPTPSLFGRLFGRPDHRARAAGPQGGFCCGSGSRERDDLSLSSVPLCETRAFETFVHVLGGLVVADRIQLIEQRGTEAGGRAFGATDHIRCVIHPARMTQRADLAEIGIH